jgi:hypothetical protein
MTELRERLAASVGGMERLAGFYSARTMRDTNERAKREVEGAAQMIEETVERIGKALAKEGLLDFAQPNDDLVGKLISKWAAYQHAGSRTANWMVTGPARFPVARNEKAMNSEHNRWVEFDSDGAVLSALLTERGFPLSEGLCAKILVPPYPGASIGFPGYSLSNNNAEIKRLQGRVRQVEAKAARVEEGEAAERVVNGVRVVEDNSDDRLRLIFDGKPAPQIISTLKSRGFRWSPRAGAWQRQLTQNARYAAEAVLKQMEGIAA